MELNKEQVAHLFKFTEKHYVEWYDVQCELVDHLANDIEHILDDQPQLSFEMARDKAFKKFGVMGFGEVVAQKRSALTKTYWRLVWQIFKEYFRLPKIVLSIGSVILIYLFLQNINFTSFILELVFGLYALVAFFFMYAALRNLKRAKKMSGKKWLFNHIIATIGQVGGYLYIPLQILVLSRQTDFTLTKLGILGVAALTVFFTLHIYISVNIVPKRMIEKMSKQFPEYQAIFSR